MENNVISLVDKIITTQKSIPAQMAFFLGAQKEIAIWELFFVTYSFSDFLFFALRRTGRLVTNLYVLFINLLT